VRTFGTVVHWPNAKQWAIECEPHVRVRIKRVFEQIAKGAHDVIMLADTPENAAELLWFLKRYPMKVRDLAVLKAHAKIYKDRATAIETVLAADYQPRAFEMALPPREYQRIAADLALRTGRLLLADDVGLGKTASAICCLTDASVLPALVVTLTHLPEQWKRELARFMPGLRVHVLKTGTPYVISQKHGGYFPDVVISNYHKLNGWAQALAGRVKTVVFDECQELRIPRSDKYSAAHHIASQATLKIGLSATPIYNMGGEIHSVLDVIAPSEMGTKLEFEREWCGANSHNRGAEVKDPKALGYYLREMGLMLRRTRADVGRELPPISRIPYEVDSDPQALENVSKAVEELARVILAAGGTSPFQKLKASEELSWRLRQATGIAKAPYVAQFVRLLVEGGERVVLYGWHREVYSIWADLLKDLNPVFFTGEESVNQKQASKEAFVSGESKVLIMSLRAGAGLDGLQGVTRTVVFGELDWSPGVHEQCIGRVHRDGQGQPVTAFFLIADAGSDPVVADVLGIKAAQAKAVNDPDAPLVAQLQSDPDRIKHLAEDFMRRKYGTNQLNLLTESAA
jgi:SNF2 family DNA or RNA helicase